MSIAAEWLRSRVKDAPPRLMDAMIAALPLNDDIAVAETLAEGAFLLYSQVVSSAGHRDDALALLAADALFTHAFAAQAEFEPSRILDFASRWSGYGRFAALTT